MYNKKTVFVIGAGASWHYGYPTGEGLIRKAIQKSASAAGLFHLAASADLPKFVRNRPDKREIRSHNDIRNAYSKAFGECQRLNRPVVKVA